MKTRIIIEAEREGYSPEQIRRTITARELINYLEDCPEDALLYLSHDNGYTYGGITLGRINEEEVWDDDE